MRCINVVNFIRGVEPRFQTDLLLPVQKQMELILKRHLPASWLLQFDALVAGPFVGYLKEHIAKDHEVGFWFEMNEMLVKEAGVEWRGRPGYEWDHLPPVAFTIGYSPDERIKLADTAMKRFRVIWGKYPSSIASWNLDAISLAHLSEKYGIDAYAVCRDQIATDGFTIWGAPIAGYYPSKSNCWSPAVERRNQIDTPVFRMLGQDPVYYYSTELDLPDGKVVRGPITMEPTWITGQSPVFVKNFLHMISDSPTGHFAYAQIGQENSFPWEGTAVGYPLQVDALSKLRESGSVHVETMGETGRRFKRSFKMTPSQAQVMLTDPFGNTNPAQRTVWYQSRFYRANLHFKGDMPFLRDLTVYSDHNGQPFLKQATRQNDVEQRMPAVLDGFHWRKRGEQVAGGFLRLDGQDARISGEPRIREESNALVVELTLASGGVLHFRFDEEWLSIEHKSTGTQRLTLAFEWDKSKASLIEVESKRVAFRIDGFDYAVKMRTGFAKVAEDGWTASEDHRSISLQLAQPS